MTSEELREIRQALDWTQQQLADALYVSQQAVAQWEAGTVSVTARRARQIRDVAASADRDEGSVNAPSV